MLILLAGCGYRSSQPAAGVTEFHFATSTYFGITLIPLALAAIGILVLLRARELLLKIFAVGGLLILLLASLTVLPAIWMDKVVVDNQGVRQTTGFWWSPNIKQYQFAQVKEVKIVRKPAGPGDHVQDVWEVTGKDGSTFNIDPGDLWDNAADPIVTLSAEHGVPVHDAR